MPRGLPVFLLAFANDHVNKARYLRNLKKEERAIRGALDTLIGTLIAEVIVLNDATVDDVQREFLKPRLAGRIAVFHFGGHASGSELVLGDGSGGPASSHAGGLATFLGQQQGLELVFLNGCSTSKQVELLREAGVEAVIGTSTAVDDEVASQFAETFYQALRSHPLGEAYTIAEAAVRNKRGDDARAVLRSDHRDLRPPGSSEAIAWPWTLAPPPERCRWRLVREPVPPWWKKVLVAGLPAAGVLAVGALAVTYLPVNPRQDERVQAPPSPQGTRGAPQPGPSTTPPIEETSGGSSTPRNSIASGSSTASPVGGRGGDSVASETTSSSSTGPTNEETSGDQDKRERDKSSREPPPGTCPPKLVRYMTAELPQGPTGRSTMLKVTLKKGGAITATMEDGQSDNAAIKKLRKGSAFWKKHFKKDLPCEADLYWKR